METKIKNYKIYFSGCLNKLPQTNNLNNKHLFIYLFSPGGPKTKIKLLAGYHSLPVLRGNSVSCLLLCYSNLSLHFFCFSYGLVLCHFLLLLSVSNLPLPSSSKDTYLDLESIQIIQDDIFIIRPLIVIICKDLFPKKTISQVIGTRMWTYLWQLPFHLIHRYHKSQV